MWSIFANFFRSAFCGSQALATSAAFLKMGWNRTFAACDTNGGSHAHSQLRCQVRQVLLRKSRHLSLTLTGI